jgi:hypothetical protein
MLVIVVLLLFDVEETLLSVTERADGLSCFSCAGAEGEMSISISCSPHPTQYNLPKISSTPSEWLS